MVKIYVQAIVNRKVFRTPTPIKVWNRNDKFKIIMGA